MPDTSLEVLNKSHKRSNSVGGMVGLEHKIIVQNSTPMFKQHNGLAFRYFTKSIVGHHLCSRNAKDEKSECFAILRNTVMN